MSFQARLRNISLVKQPVSNKFLPPSVIAVTRAPEAGVIFQRGRRISLTK